MAKTNDRNNGSARLPAGRQGAAIARNLEALGYGL